MLKFNEKFGYIIFFSYLCNVKEKMDIERIKQLLIEKKKKEDADEIEKFNRLNPFRTIDDIPSIPKIKDPRTYEEVVVKNLIRCGAISKDKLEIGAIYEGNCRNTDKATWNGKQFEYKRYKFGEWQDDKINHFQDDNGYDLFVPIKKL